jgi:integrase
MARKFQKRKLSQGVFVVRKKGRDYVEIRMRLGGKDHYEFLGRADEPGILADAEARRNHLKELDRQGKLDLETAKLRLTINEAAEVFWKLYGHMKTDFRGALDRMKEFMGERLLDQVTRLDVQAFRDWLADKFNLCDATVNRSHMVLTNMYNRFYEWKEDLADYRSVVLPVNNPGERCRMPDCSYRDRTRVVTPEEFDSLMLYADTKMRRILLGLIHSLLRQCDLRALSKSKNIDQDRNCFVGLQKKSKRKFEPPITPEMWAIIQTTAGDLIFPDFPQNFPAPFRHLCKRAGVLNLQPRDLRRSGARRLLKKGQDIAIVQKYLGHGDVRTTQRYVGAQPAELQEAGKVLSTDYRWPTQPVKEVGLCANCQKQPADTWADHGLCIFCFSLTKRKWRPVRLSEGRISPSVSPPVDNPQIEHAKMVRNYEGNDKLVVNGHLILANEQTWVQFPSPAR